MNRALGISFAIFLMSAASAAFGDGKIHVQPLDPNFDASGMSNDQTVVHSVDEANAPGQRFDLPTAEESKKFFSQSGLSKSVSKMDELDRDRLILRARSFNADELSKLYPDLPKKGLAKLVETIRRSDASKRKAAHRR